MWKQVCKPSKREKKTVAKKSESNQSLYISIHKIKLMWPFDDVVNSGYRYGGGNRKWDQIKIIMHEIRKVVFRIAWQTKTKSPIKKRRSSKCVCACWPRWMQTIRSFAHLKIKQKQTKKCSRIFLLVCLYLFLWLLLHIRTHKNSNTVSLFVSSFIHWTV